MAASLSLVLEAGLVVAVLLVVLAGSQLPGSLIFARLTPGPVLIAIFWVVGLKLIGGPGSHLPWADRGEAPDGQDKPRGHARRQTEQDATQRRVSTTRATLVFGVAALLTLVAGVSIDAAVRPSLEVLVCPACSSAPRCWRPRPRCRSCPQG